MKCALGWARSAAARHGITASNVSVAGDSAGGQLALMAHPAVQGGRDHMIPTGQATALVDRLRAAGVPSSCGAT